MTLEDIMEAVVRHTNVSEEELKEIAFDKIDIHWNDFSEGSYKAVNRLRDECFIAGYNEAMRWRNPKEELPNEGEEVQLEIFDTHHNQLEYTHDVYLGGRWRFCESKYIEILGWRPIK